MEELELKEILDKVLSKASNQQLIELNKKINQYVINYQYENDVLISARNNFNGNLCPHCGHQKSIKHGKDEKGNQRYLCDSCGKTYSHITGTLLSYTKKDAQLWYLYIQTLLEGMTIEQSAKKVGICK